MRRCFIGAGITKARRPLLVGRSNSSSCDEEGPGFKTYLLGFAVLASLGMAYSLAKKHNLLN